MTAPGPTPWQRSAAYAEYERDGYWIGSDGPDAGDVSEVDASEPERPDHYEIHAVGCTKPRECDC